MVERMDALTHAMGEAVGSADYELVAQAIRYLEEHAAAQPSLADVAGQLGVSQFHLQRVFTRWAGVSPKRFVQYLTLEHAKRLLDESRPVLDAAYEAGLSGPGRLHDLFVTVEAVTPGEYRASEGLTIRYGRHPRRSASRWRHGAGVCAVVSGWRGWDAAVADLRWPEAHLERAA